MQDHQLFGLVLLGCLVASQSQLLNFLRPIEFLESFIKDSDGRLEQEQDASLETGEIVRRYGYPSESHVIRTADGYLLTLHRIPCSRRCNNDGSHIQRQPVLLQHGLLSDSSVWVTSGPVSSFAFILSEAGYDVWLGNLRGTPHSNKHIDLSTSPRSSYWNFSWHEMGVYDLPAQIDFIEDHKAAEGYDHSNDLIYIGHSMGTTVSFVLLSTRPEYNNKLAAVIAMAPLMYMRYVRSPLRSLTSLPVHDDDLFWLFGGSVVDPDYRVTMPFTAYACTITRVEMRLCDNFLFAVAGYDKRQFNESLYPVVKAHTPVPTSSKTISHYIQEMKAGGNFQRYDYGFMGNNKRYGNRLPRIYDVSRITAPVALLYGDGDLLATTRDVLGASTRLSNVIAVYKVPYRQFQHLDFLWANNAPSLVYRQVLNLIRNYH